MNSKIRTFPFTVRNFNAKILDAVRHYWKVRLKQEDQQRQRGNPDAGTRGQVTGGKQLDAFGRLLEHLAKSAGFRRDEIFVQTPLPVPGYYRPQKKWDFAVCRNGRLIAVAEFKSQVGSIGNNFNNRAEEVIGLARDFWVSYREKVFGLSAQPWLGYLFLLEESETTSHFVRLHPSNIPPLEKFKQTSYRDRYKILCETLLLERDFSATALLASRRPETACPVTYDEPFPELSVYSFCHSLFAHLVASAHV